MSVRFFPVLFLCLFVAACSTTYKPAPVTPQHLDCGGGAPAFITFFSPKDAVLQFENIRYRLERAETTQGVQYENDDISFWSKGIDALITKEDGPAISCAVVPKAGL